ncbi:MAG: cobalamin-binding protein [Deltaproteobacteria bacterium]|nr:cobalamin-binding protein [Deltaproteobacteria bacterium]MBW1872072.1 cobalamin-binding protein [Deltaproteobacteria bacterium]
MIRVAVTWLTVLLLSATAGAQPASELYLGKPRPTTVPQRVVSLAPNLTEILFAIEAGDKIVGVTRYDDFPEEVKKLPKIGGFLDPSLEAILALRPNLVVCVKNSGAKDRLEALARMGVPILVLPAYRMKDIYTSIRVLGEVFHKTDVAQSLIQTMKTRVKRVEQKVKGLPKPAVLLVYGHRPVVAAGSDSFGDAMLSLAGGENVLKKTKIRYPMVPMEQVIHLKPQVIIDASASGTGAEMTQSELEKTWKTWKIVPAIKTGRLHFFDSALWFRPGPRIVDGLEKLAEILHPE